MLCAGDADQSEDETGKEKLVLSERRKWSVVVSTGVSQRKQLQAEAGWGVLSERVGEDRG